MRRRLVTFAAMWAAWTAYALFNASQNFLSRAYGSSIAWKPALRYALLDSYSWLVFTPLAFFVAGKLVVHRGNWWKTVPALVFGGIAFGAAHLFVFVQALPLIGYSNSPRAVGTIVRGKLHADVLSTWVLFGLRHAIEYYKQFRVREWKASQLEAQLTRAQLEVLRMQLQPHFLFNTLHAISALMYRSVEGADRMLAQLSDLLRLTLDSTGIQEVALKREMEYLDKYIQIEQVRFGDRLQVHRAIDPATLDLLVPNLAMQPLVENAVRYAVAPRAAGATITVAARVEDGSLVVEVADDGPGTTGEIREGIGLANTRARIEQLYGTAAALELENVPAGGFRARLIIPAHAEPYARADR